MQNCIATNGGCIPFNYISLDKATDIQLFSARAYCWTEFFDSDKNPVGQTLRGGKDFKWCTCAKAIESELIYRGLDPKDKSWKAAPRTPENRCVVINSGHLAN